MTVGKLLFLSGDNDARLLGKALGGVQTESTVYHLRVVIKEGLFVQGPAGLAGMTAWSSKSSPPTTAR